MHLYKMRNIIDFIRKQGKLPTDPYGEILSPEDLLVWFELDGSLSRYEQITIKRELAAMTEAELAIEKLQQAQALRGDD